MIIVIESPGKVKKIAQYTGAKVIPTIGHFKDLPKKSLGIDLETYNPTFEWTDPAKKRNIYELKKIAKGQDVYIATDADREGEAIGRFIYEEIKKSGAKNIYRALFLEINKTGIEKGLREAVPYTEINYNDYSAFLGRRVLDRLTGFLLSPKANNTLSTGNETIYYSVGRVQSPGVRILVEREREIQNFTPKKYSVINALCEKDNIEFKLIHENDRFFEQEKAKEIYNNLVNEKYGTVISKETKPYYKKPGRPFTTASLQQKASSKLHMSPEQTMKAAQKLYENGYITYHRTDSEFISEEYLNKIGNFLKQNYKNAYKGPVQYKSKNSQAEAHEGIRPAIDPEQIESSVLKISQEMDNKTAKLFELISNRVIESQMKSAIYDRTKIVIEIKGEKFKTTGSILTSEGFLAFSSDETDEEDNSAKKMKEEKETKLPNIKEGDKIKINKIILDETKKTEPPKRYTEAALVAKLEKAEIGRPSTYATIMSTIKKREYATLSKKVLIPTNRAEKLISFLEKDSPWLIDYDFTSEMEANLDKVANDGLDWKILAKEIHGRMGYIKPLTKGPRKITPKMKAYAEAVIKKAERYDIEIDSRVLEEIDFISLLFEGIKEKNVKKWEPIVKGEPINISTFLKALTDKAPSEKQLKFAEQLSKQKGIKLEDKDKKDKTLLSKWIDKAMKKKSYGVPTSLSEKQKAIITKHAPEKLKKIVDSTNQKDLKELKEFIDNFFKNFKK